MSVFYGIVIFMTPELDAGVKRAYDTLHEAGFLMVPADHPEFADALRRAVGILDGTSVPDAPPASW